MNRPETKADKPADAQLQFVCIHCGHPVDSLYKQYSSSVLKIIECVSGLYVLIGAFQCMQTHSGQLRRDRRQVHRVRADCRCY